MNKEELFEKYSINESHHKWESCDDRNSVEIYRMMHNGNLPDDDQSVKYVLDFLDKMKTDIPWWVSNVMSRPDYGSIYLTAKRTIRLFADDLINQTPAARQG